MTTWDDPSGDDPFGDPGYRSVVDAVDLDPFLGRVRPEPEIEPDPPAPGTPPLLALRDLMGDHRFVELFGRALRSTDPGLREVLPSDPAPILERFVQAMAYALETTEHAEGDQAKVDEVVRFARHLGTDHRKLALTDELYAAFGDALVRTLRRLAGPAWDSTLEQTLATVYEVLTTAMREGAAEVPGPVRIGATVVQVTRPARGIAVVRLIADQMVEYLPGQYLSVMTPYAHGVWRRFSPSNPSNPARQLEFHIREVPGGTLSEALVRSVAPGDRWVVARPLGHLEIDRTRTEEGFRDVLVVAGGTGIAPIHCLLVDMLRFAENPRVHLFYGARYPGELEDLRELVENAGTAPWLTIQPVVEETEDPWWMGETPELPRTLHRPVTGRLVDVVTGYGSWADRQVLVSGSPDMIRATVRGMVAAGTPRESISFDRF